MRKTASAAAGISALLLLIICAACSPLPADWPIKELTLPASSKAAAVPRNARILREKLNHVEGIGDRLPLTPKWEVAFNNKDASWETMVGQVEAQIIPLGFKEWTPAHPQAEDKHAIGLGGSTQLSQVLKIYESADGKLLINFINTSLMTASGDTIDVEGSYVLGIMQRP